MVHDSNEMSSSSSTCMLAGILFPSVPVVGISCLPGPCKGTIMGEKLQVDNKISNRREKTRISRNFLGFSWVHTFASGGGAAAWAPPSGEDFPSPGGAVATGSSPNSNALMASKHFLFKK